MSPERFVRLTLPWTICALFCAAVIVTAVAQERPPLPAPPAERAKPITKTFPPPAPPKGDTFDQAVSKVEKLIASYDLRPQPLPAIPDNPPPHEGAMINVPFVVAPPDLVLVEVLDALPGRPISGERLIYPDGTIDLGFYGKLPVRGLNTAQIKLAVIKHLRSILTDETLGLVVPVEEPEAEEPPAVDPTRAGPRIIVPDAPKGVESPFAPPKRDAPAGSPPQKPRTPFPSSDRPRSPGTRPTLRRAARGPIPIHRVRGEARVAEPGAQAGPAPEAKQFQIDVGDKGRVSVTIQVERSGRAAAEEARPEPPADAEQERWQVVKPEQSTHVFVAVTAFNSANYYVLGDLVVPGRLPITGNETVLDALRYAGGLVPTAEPKDIRLVRPGRDGMPARVYPVDLSAIEERGDVRTNYQLFPGDRLIVGRNEVVKKTVEIDRLAAPLQAIAGSIQQDVTLLKALGPIAPEQGEQVLKELVDFWAKELSRKGDVQLDELRLREILLHRLKSAPAPNQPK
jgi:protein involved in polysaccharide export with SLBB domain